MPCRFIFLDISCWSASIHYITKPKTPFIQLRGARDLYTLKICFSQCSLLGCLRSSTSDSAQKFVAEALVTHTRTLISVKDVTILFLLFFFLSSSSHIPKTTCCCPCRRQQHQHQETLVYLPVAPPIFYPSRWLMEESGPSNRGYTWWP